MQVGIATDAEFARLGMIRDVFLTWIILLWVGRCWEASRPLHRCSLRGYLDLIVEARWPDGRLLRLHLAGDLPRATEDHPWGLRWVLPGRRPSWNSLG